MIYMMCGSGLGFAVSTQLSQLSTFDVTPCGNTHFAYFPTVEHEIEDLRHSPKMWATWFREFLQEILPPAFTLAIPRMAPCLSRIARRSRSRTARESRWKLKSWKQAHT